MGQEQTVPVKNITIQVQNLTIKNDEDKSVTSAVEEKVEENWENIVIKEGECDCTKKVKAFYCEMCRQIHYASHSDKYDHILSNKFCHSCHKPASDSRRKAILAMMRENKVGDPYSCPECKRVHMPGSKPWNAHRHLVQN